MTPPHEVNRICAGLVAAVAEAGLPASVGSVVRIVAERSGRPIELRPVHLGGTEVFGMWLGLADRDLILFDDTASPAHRNHIVQHELGHMVLEHPGVSDIPDSRCRSDFHDPVEDEAERFAAELTRLLRRYSAAAGSASVARRITDTLTGGASYP